MLVRHDGGSQCSTWWPWSARRPGAAREVQTPLIFPDLELGVVHRPGHAMKHVDGSSFLLRLTCCLCCRSVKDISLRRLLWKDHSMEATSKPTAINFSEIHRLIAFAVEISTPLRVAQFFAPLHLQ